MRNLFYTLIVIMILSILVFLIGEKKKRIGLENDVIKQIRTASGITDTVNTFDRDQLIQLLDETGDTPTLFVPDGVEVPSGDNQ